MPYERNPDELGCLWLKSGGKGEYMTGEISGVKVFCVPVQSENPKSPTWRVLKSKPKDAMATPPAGTHNANDIDIEF
jgi:hypothetical protein